MNAPEPVMDFQAWEAQQARREALTCEATVSACVERSIAAIQRVMLLGHTIRCAFSAGKDSSCLLSCAVEAAVRLREAGEPVPDIHVVSADTLIENPEVSALMRGAHDLVAEYGAANGLTIHCEITKPRLSERWWVKIIGGSKLPTWENGTADCSVNLKVRPLGRLARTLDRRLAARGALPSVTLLGTRFAESDARKSAMTRRGESETELSESDIGGHRLLTLSPLALWQTETVWAYLQQAGRSKRYRSFAHDFSEVYAAYDAASGGECVVYVDPTQAKRADGCGSSRFGCTQCQRVTEEKSLRNLLMMTEEYGYLRPLYELRTYIRNSRWDLSKRRWVGRQLDPATGALKVFPNNLSSREVEVLLRLVLTIDKREAQRAEKHARRLALGLIEDNARNRRLAQPQWQQIGPDDLIAIDFSWSLNGLHPPHHAIRVAFEVQDGSGEMDVPKIEPAPRVPIPATRYRIGNTHHWHSALGMRDAELEWHLFDGEGHTYRTNPKTGAAEDRPAWRDDQLWDIDPESALMFLDFEAERRLQETEGLGVEYSVSAVDYYLRLGVIGYPHRSRHILDAMMRQLQYLVSMGLAGEVPAEQALQGSLSEAEYRQVLAGVAPELKAQPACASEQQMLFDLAA